MQHFHCQCGTRVFFGNTHCLACGRELGFDPELLSIVALDTQGDSLQASASDRRYLRCNNQLEHGNCNWLRPESEGPGLCLSCGLNDVIPSLSRTGNLRLWTRVERAKRRLLYSLLRLQLPLVRAGGKGMRFRILEDRRRNPAVYESFVATAHLDGTITLNIAEADDVARLAVREQMQERYRTVLGHLRHESGHFYFSLLTADADDLAECRDLFGDETLDYEAALQEYYRSGPREKWHEQYVSAYASAHPAEDFAETFAHLLHIWDALETARSAGLAPPEHVTSGDWIGEWIELAITLNEIGRSLGSDDAYPFVLTTRVRAKLEFMNRLVRRPVAPSAG